MPVKKNAVRYVGRYAAVSVPVLGDIMIEQGQEVVVDDDALLASLLEQPSNWEQASGSRAPSVDNTEEEEGEAE